MLDRMKPPRMSIKQVLAFRKIGFQISELKLSEGFSNFALAT